MTTTLDELIEKHDPCAHARAWLKSEGIKTPSEAWKKCRDPEWMLWTLEKIGYADDRVLLLWSCWCVRQVWHLLTDERSRRAVEVAEAFVEGRASQEDLAAACAAARAAARAAESTAECAAKWAAARAAEWAAESTAECAAARAAARAAAWAAARAAQCDHLREITGNPFAPAKRKRSLARKGEASALPAGT